MRRVTNSLVRYIAIACAGTLVLILTLPLVGLLHSLTGESFIAALHAPLVLPALKLSAMTTGLSLGIVVTLGTPLSWLLARSHGRLTRVVETLVSLPVVVPPAVAGVAMLLAFGRHGLLSGILYPKGWSISFTTGAVVLAEVFVSAPFFVQAATHAFRQIDENLLHVGRTLGASPLRIVTQITLPLAAPGLVAGAAMSWARSLGEFGATMLFAGNLPGKTQTLPLAIYTALESDTRVAQALSLLLLGFALLVFLVIRTTHVSPALGRGE